MIHDNLNPQFIKKMLVDFHFEQSDRYKIEVYDSDDDTQQIKSTSKHNFIGVYEFKLHEVVTARDQMITRNLENQAMGAGKAGRIVI